MPPALSPRCHPVSQNGGAGEWVEVAFLADDAGKKKLIVAFANLEKVEEQE